MKFAKIAETAQLGKIAENVQVFNFAIFARIANNPKVVKIDKPARNVEIPEIAKVADVDKTATNARISKIYKLA